ncbi:MAG: hypothetical protein PVI78_13015 [Anaerolineales bacterium]|jgi:hypothetical protein
MTSLYDRVTGDALYLLSRIIGGTCRVQCTGIEYFHDAIASGRPVIATAWHGKAYMVISSLVKFYDTSNFAVIMPNDWRGGTLEVLTRRIGAIPLQVNLFDDPTMGAGREIVKLVRMIIGGTNTIIAPDGPDGPAYVPKPGVTYIARKAQAIIVPVGGYCRHAYRLNRWDHYVLPYPFSKIAIHVGKPFTIPPGRGDLSPMNEHLTNVLHRVTAQAAADFYADRPSWRRG